GEGVYGVTLVAANSRGVASPAPVSGDAPDWWVEVDTTRPVVQLTKVEPAFADGKTSVHIVWSARDKHLDETPVDLLVGSTPQGPRVRIAKGWKADGAYRWLPTPDAGAKAFIRVAARDKAGNDGSVCSREAVSLVPAPPRAVIRSITTPPTIAPPTVPPSQFEIVQPPPIR